MSNATPKVWHWSDITQTELVCRLFPDASKTGLLSNDIIPGRYWKAWTVPPDATDLDKEIQKFIEECRKKNSDLESIISNMGIDCPYYVWRMHVAISAQLATHSFKSINQSRISEIESEIKLWKAKISSSKSLVKLNPERSLPYGSVYLRTGQGLGPDPLDILRERMNTVENIKYEIERDEMVVEQLESEIERIISELPKGTGNAAPDTWKTPFFIYLANLWKIFAQKEVPFDCAGLAKILQSATTVISGGEKAISKWNMVKTLRNEVFREQLPMEGFRFHEIDIFDTMSDYSISQRGRSIAALIRISQGAPLIDPMHSTLACGALWLRDHCEGDLALLVREVILIPELEKAAILCPLLSLQLGWIKRASTQEIRNALRASLKVAQSGDLCASFTVEVVCRYNDELENIATKFGWNDLSQRISIKNIYEDLNKRDVIDPDHCDQTGDHKAFRVVMSLLESKQWETWTMDGAAKGSLLYDHQTYLHTTTHV